MKTLTLYRTTDKIWRWNLRAKNGRIIGASTEAYAHRQSAIQNVRQVTGFFLCVTPDEKRATKIVRKI